MLVELALRWIVEAVSNHVLKQMGIGRTLDVLGSNVSYLIDSVDINWLCVLVNVGFVGVVDPNLNPDVANNTSILVLPFDYGAGWDAIFVDRDGFDDG